MNWGRARTELRHSALKAFTVDRMTILINFLVKDNEVVFHRTKYGDGRLVHNWVRRVQFLSNDSFLIFKQYDGIPILLSLHDDVIYTVVCYFG